MLAASEFSMLWGPPVAKLHARGKTHTVQIKSMHKLQHMNRKKKKTARWRGTETHRAADPDSFKQKRMCWGTQPFWHQPASTCYQTSHGYYCTFYHQDPTKDASIKTVLLSTNIPSAHTKCSSPKVKNPILEAYKTWEVARPSFLPKAWSTPTPSPFLPTSASPPGTVLLLLPVTGAQGREAGRSHSCQEGGNQLRYSLFKGPAPCQAHRSIAIQVTTSTCSAQKTAGSVASISALLVLGTAACTRTFSACLQSQKYCKIAVLSPRRKGFPMIFTISIKQRDVILTLLLETRVCKKVPSSLTPQCAKGSLEMLWGKEKKQHTAV